MKLPHDATRISLGSSLIRTGLNFPQQKWNRRLENKQWELVFMEKPLSTSDSRQPVLPPSLWPHHLIKFIATVVKNLVSEFIDKLWWHQHDGGLKVPCPSDTPVWVVPVILDGPAEPLSATQRLLQPQPLPQSSDWLASTSEFVRMSSRKFFCCHSFDRNKESREFFFLPKLLAEVGSSQANQK